MAQICIELIYKASSSCKCGSIRNNSLNYSPNLYLKWRYLCSNSPTNLNGYIIHSNRLLFPLWAHLETAVETGAASWEVKAKKKKKKRVNCNQWRTLYLIGSIRSVESIWSFSTHLQRIFWCETVYECYALFWIVTLEWICTSVRPYIIHEAMWLGEDDERNFLCMLDPFLDENCCVLEPIGRRNRSFSNCSLETIPTSSSFPFWFATSDWCTSRRKAKGCMIPFISHLYIQFF